eukprot:10675484-Ditylum_brightwellii.AAC.1
MDNFEQILHMANLGAVDVVVNLPVFVCLPPGLVGVSPAMMIVDKKGDRSLYSSLQSLNDRW